MSRRWLVWMVGVAGVLSTRLAFATLSVPGNVVDNGNVVVGQSGTVTAAISSDAADTLDHFDLVGANCTRFTLLPSATLPHAITAVTPMDLDVVFAPLARGTVTCAVTMRDAANASLGTFTLQGTGAGNAVIGVTDVSFNIVPILTTSTKTITVSNTAMTNPVALNVQSATINGGDGWFTFDTNGSFACAGATTCTFGASGTNVPPNLTVGVRCRPPAGSTGTMTATVDFTSDSDNNTDASSALSCVAGRADASPDPTSISYADTVVGQSNGPTTVTVTNTGNQALTFTASKNGTQSSFYTLAGCITNCSVGPGLQQTFTVTFAPTAPIQANISIDLASNDPDGVVSIPITGKGIAPGINAPPSVAFGAIDVGQTGTPHPLTVSNDGTSTLTISNAVFGGANPGDYAAQTGTIGAQTTQLAPGTSTTWNLVCHPGGANGRNATFVVTSDAFGETTTTVTLTCSGNLGTLVLNPTSINFGGVAQGAVSTRAYTLRNTGNVTVSGITATLDKTTVGYSLDPTTPVPATLAAGAQVSLNVKFAPQSGTDGGPASVAFAGTWGATPSAANATLGLDGDGLVAGFDVTPPALDFMSVRFDATKALTFCIVNTGQADVAIQNPIAIAPATGTMTGEFTVTRIRRQTTCGTAGTNVTLPQTLLANQANQILEVQVTVNPANRTGPMAATVTVTSDLGMNPTRTVALTATSTSAMLAVTPGATLDFGAVDVQGSAVTKTITITNTGDGSLDLAGFARTPNNPHFTFALPAAQSLAPGAHLDIAITYKPVAAAAAGSEEAFMLTHTIAGILGGPTTNSILVKGRGIDRKLVVSSVPIFPDTFRNPGDAAPVRAVTVTNPGEAVLHVSAVMVSNDTDVWQLVDMDPVDIPGKGTHDFLVRFAPKLAGKAPEAHLELVNDDIDPPATQPRTTNVNLAGNGIGRNVLFAPTDIDLGFTGIGIPVTLPDALVVTSMDGANTFTIARIAMMGAPELTVDGTVQNIELAPSATRTFAVTFTPESEGDFMATAQLFLDMDSEAQAEVRIRGRAVFVDAHGGGGCSTGGGSAGLAMVLAIGAILMRRRTLAALVATLFAPAAARADNVVLSTFDPTPSTTGTGFQVQSAEVGNDGDFAVSAIASYASNPLVLDAILDGKFVNDDAVVSSSTRIELGGAYAFANRFELGARMPLYFQDGAPFGDSQQMFTTAPANGTARGDLTLFGKARLWHSARRASGTGGTALALAGSATLPTATDGAFTGSDKPSARVLALATFAPAAMQGRITLSANAGGVLRATSRFANLEQKSGIAWGFGASVRLLDALWVAGEVFGDVVPSGRSDEMDRTQALSPIEWLGGVQIRPDRRFAIGLAVGRGVTQAAGSPALRGVFALTITPSAQELKPIVPPKPDGDADGDRILDSRDRCPNEAEDYDQFDDTDGCPDLDNDNDGVPDAADKCPILAEDKDGFQDDDGCPDNDNDGDGIPDAKDKCPGDAEDFDGFDDLDGCPEPDNDHDGLLDAKDKCPQEPETINGIKDEDGCPDAGDPMVVVAPDRIEVLDSIQFTGAKIAKSSFNVLGQIGAQLRAHEEILRLRITCHVNPRDPDKDQDLSDKRAQAIRDWLVQYGIAEKRLEARGFGSTKPLVSATARNAQQINDRIEMIVLERK